MVSKSLSQSPSLLSFISVLSPSSLSGVTKTHKLPYEPKIQSLPNGPPEDSPNHLIMSPNCARNWTDHFLGPKSGEISLWVTDQTCVVRSSEDIPPLNPTKASKDSTGDRMQITTEIVVSISDFEEYNIGQETRLTFNLKEFKVRAEMERELHRRLKLFSQQYPQILLPFSDSNFSYFLRTSSL